MKTRGDSKLDALTEEQKALLEKWLFAENVTYSEARKRCQLQFSLSVSIDALGQWRRRLEREKLADRALKQALAKASESAASAQAVVRSLEELKDPFWDALKGQIGQLAFERTMEGQQLPLKNLKDLTIIMTEGLRDSIAREKITLGREKLAQMDRRLKLLEAREAKTREVVTDAKLSPEEKEARVKEIFGI